MASDGVVADGPEKQCGGGVIDAPVRHCREHTTGVFQRDIAFRCHKRRKHTLGILPAGILGAVAHDDADDNFLVLFRVCVSDEPADVAVDIQAVDLPTKKADVCREINSQVFDER